MKSTFDKIKEKLSGNSDADAYSNTYEEDYVEISSTPSIKTRGSKIIVRPFVVEDFSDIKPALDALREGYTVALINIKPLKDKDLVELKRAVNKLKKTCDAIEGDIAGFGEDWIVVTPGFASIYRGAESTPVAQGV